MQNKRVICLVKQKQIELDRRPKAEVAIVKVKYIMWYNNLATKSLMFPCWI